MEEGTVVAHDDDGFLEWVLRAALSSMLRDGCSGLLSDREANSRSSVRNTRR